MLDLFLLTAFIRGAGIAQWYSAGLWTGIPAVAGNFSLHHRVQTSSEAQSASYPMGISDYFTGDKAAGE